MTKYKDDDWNYWYYDWDWIDYYYNDGYGKFSDIVHIPQHPPVISQVIFTIIWLLRQLAQLNQT